MFLVLHFFFHHEVLLKLAIKLKDLFTLILDERQKLFYLIFLLINHILQIFHLPLVILCHTVQISLEVLVLAMEVINFTGLLG